MYEKKRKRYWLPFFYLMGVKPRHSWRGCKPLPQSGNNMIDPHENWW